MEEVSKLVTRLGAKAARRILDDHGELSEWLSGKRPVPPLIERRARVANQMCMRLGDVLDRDALRAWWRAKVSTFGGSPAEAVSKARRDEDFDELLDAADRFGASHERSWPRPDDKEPLPRGEQREQRELERRPTKRVDPARARRVKIDDDGPRR